ncbi:MAG TPA: DDE-type integrase/transposase/recombinase [Gemmataceae bacterium]|nr:DDE-type integrase/transposase/recombinase [Gemmataceae bacterium]
MTLSAVASSLEKTKATMNGRTELEMFTEDHLTRLECISQRGGTPVSDPRQRGFVVQQTLRELERSIRLGVLNFCHQGVVQGLGRQELAKRLALSPRTLRHWERSWRQGGLPICARGRPLACSEPEQQQAVVHVLHQLGPGTGLAVLQGQFPEMARAELQDLLRCFRWAWVGQHPRLLHVLHWKHPGRVWAMDYAEAPCWIDGCYRYVLAVRDLASGQQLLWLPMLEATAASTVAQLARLFAFYGAPLVLKSDNGSSFSAEAMQEFLQCWGVRPLFSPPQTPAYNGSCEAAIGSMKTRTAYQAERDGHARQWSSENLATAQEQANETARPHGPKGPTPAQAWRQRDEIRVSERRAFDETVRVLEREVHERQELPLDQKLDRAKDAAVQREVLRRALVAHGHLLFTRRRIPIPIRGQKAAKIR